MSNLPAIKDINDLRLEFEKKGFETQIDPRPIQGKAVFILTAVKEKVNDDTVEKRIVRIFYTAYINEDNEPLFDIIGLMWIGKVSKLLKNPTHDIGCYFHMFIQDKSLIEQIIGGCSPFIDFHIVRDKTPTKSKILDFLQTALDTVYCVKIDSNDVSTAKLIHDKKYSFNPFITYS